MRLAQRLDRFNAAHPWSHNDAFSGFVMKHARSVARAGGTVAIDVGCGAGNLVRKLATVFPAVIGVEPDEQTARTAMELSEATRIRIETRYFGSEPASAYDLIVFVASLHHMPLEAALITARDALRPGGRLIVVGVAHPAARDAGRSVVSALLNPIIGLVRHPRRAKVAPTHMLAPTAEPTQTFDEIRTTADRILPGIRMRRRLFWRYTAVWVRDSHRDDVRRTRLEASSTRVSGCASPPDPPASR